VNKLEERISKPPKGILPRNLWEEKRIYDLSLAIMAYVSFGKYEPIIPWIEELLELSKKQLPGKEQVNVYGPKEKDTK
jgi:hypothetical protein